MYSKIVITLFSLLLAVSFSAEAGFKSSYKSSYRSSYKSSYKPSTSSKSYSSSSSSSSSSQSNSAASKAPAPASSKPLTTSQKVAITGSGAALASGNVTAVEKSSVSNRGDVVGKAGGGAVGITGAQAASKSANVGTAGAVAPKKSVSGAELVAKKGIISTSNQSSAKSPTVPPSQRMSGTSGRDYASLSKSAPENVRTIIRERERGGTDWTTLAMMYWMISSSNSHASSLSSSDKDWIQRQIKEQESNGGNREEAISELKAAGVDTSTLNSKPTVVFSYDMPKAFTADHVWVFVVAAAQDDKKQAPSCDLQGATFTARNDKLFVKWKAPATAGQKTEMKCKAFGVEEVKTLVSA